MINKTYKKLASILLVSILVFNFLPVFNPVFATINETFNFQAKLTNVNGTNVTDGTYNFRFSIYDASTSGDCLWTAKGTIPGTGACTFAGGSPGTDLVALTVTNGLLNTQLGTTAGSLRSFEDGAASLAQFSNNSLYLDIQIYNGSSWETFGSRKLLEAVPYAFRSKYSDNAGTSTNVPISGLTLAGANNSINNGNYNQTWNWALTSASQTGLLLSENTASVSSGTPSILGVNTLASSTAIPIYVQNIGGALSFRVDDQGSDTSPFVVDASGKVGIGTDTPAAFLHVKSAGGVNSGINLEATSAASYGVIDFNTASGLAGQFLATGASFSNGIFTGDQIALASYINTGSTTLVAGGTSGYINFATGGYLAANERMRIIANGNVGIGDTTPAALFTVGNTDLFQIDSSGNIVKLNNVTTSFPGSQGAANSVLVNNGSGTLSWGTALTGVTIPISKLAAASATNTIDNTLYAQQWDWSTLSTQNALTLTGNGISTGNLLNLTSTSTALTSSSLLNILATGDPAASWTGALAKIEYTTSTDTDINGDGLRIGFTGTGAGQSTSLNITNAQIGTNSLVFRANDDGTYTDSTPFIIDKVGNVGLGVTTIGSERLNIDDTLRLVTSGTPEAGYLFGTSIPSGSITEGSGQLLSYGINVQQVGTRDTGRVGGIFRLDTRAGYEAESFVVFGSPTGGSTQYERLAVNLANGDTYLAASSGNVTVGGSNLTSLFNVGASAQFQVNSSGNIVKINNVTTSFPGSQGGTNTVLQNDGSGGLSWATALTGVTIPISKLAVASATNTIDNTLYAQTWNWNSLTTETALSLGSSSISSGTLFNLSSTSTAAAGNTQKVLNISTSGANGTSTQTTYGSYISNTHTGTSSTNIGGYFTASGGATNYPIYIGDSSPPAGSSAGLKIGNMTAASGSSFEAISIGSQSGAGTSGTGITVGTISNAGASRNYGIKLNGITGGSTIENYGISIGSVTGSDGTSYGLYIGSVSGAVSSYGIYSSSGNNFFSGNTGIGDISPASALTVGNGDLFQVNSSGNIVKINNVTTSFPGSQGGTNTVFVNDGSGGLSWATALTGVTIPISKLAVAAATNTIDNTLYAQQWDWSTLSTQNALTLTGNGISTGNLFSLTSTSTALTSSSLLNILATGNPAASWTGALAKIEYTTSTDADINGDGLRVGITGAGAGQGTALNITSAQTGTNALIFRVNDDGTYTDSTPFVIDKSGNVILGATSGTEKLEITGNQKFTGTSTIYAASRTGATGYSLSILGGDTDATNGGDVTITGGNGAINGGKVKLNNVQVSGAGIISNAFGLFSSGTIQFSALTTNGAVYTSGSNGTLTTTAPTSGALGYWSRTSTTLSPTTANDILSITGNTGDIITITSSATGASNKGLYVSQTGATTGTDYAGYFSNTGAATTNVGLYATATGGATNNYAAIFDSGNVGIGDTSPVGLFTVGSGDLFQVSSLGNVTLNSVNTTQTTTSSIISLNGNSLTSGTGFYAASSTLSSGKLIDIQVSGTAAASNTQTALNILTAGANGTTTQTTFGAVISNTHTGTLSSNVGASFSASGGTASNTAILASATGTSNNAAIFDSGNVTIRNGVTNITNGNDVLNVNKELGADLTGAWTTGATGNARSNHTSVLYNGKIYSWAGFNSGYLNGLVIYDIATNSWSSGSSGGTARSMHVSVVYKGKIYSWGGKNGGGNLNTMDIYDIAGDSWSTGTAGGTARYESAGVLYNGKIYYWGGYSGGYLNTMDIYDIAGNSWSTGTTGGTARREHTAVQYNGKIYFWSGYTGSVQDTMDIYDIAGNSWSTGTSGGGARSWSSGVLYNGKIYYWAGNNFSVYLDSISIYDIATDSWTSGVSGGTKRADHTSVIYNGKIYSWGGDSGISYTTTGIMDIYDIGNRQNILSVQENGQDTFSFQANSQLFLSSGRLSIMGGNLQIGTTTDSGYKFDVSGSTRFAGNIINTSGVNANADQESLVTNTGFEVNDDKTTTVADGWTKFTVSGSGGTASVSTTKIQGSNSQAVVLAANTDGVGFYSPCIPITGGNVYNLYVFARDLTTASNTNALTLRLGTYTSAANCSSRTSPTNYDSVTNGTVTNAFAQYGNTVSPAATQFWSRVEVQFDTPTTADTFYADSVRLTVSSLAAGVDLAENYPIEEGYIVEPGDIVSVSNTNSDRVSGIKYIRKSNGEFDPNVIGVVSTKPGITLDDGNTYTKAKVALAGRVPVKISASSEAIKAGDYITSSSEEGKAMKATRTGQVIAKALNDWDPLSPTEKIIVLIDNSYYYHRDVEFAAFTDRLNALQNTLNGQGQAINNTTQLINTSLNSNTTTGPTVSGGFEGLDLSKLTNLLTKFTIESDGSLTFNSKVKYSDQLSVDNFVTKKISSENSDILIELNETLNKNKLLVANKAGVELFSIDYKGNAKFAKNVTINGDLYVDGKIAGKSVFESKWTEILPNADITLNHLLGSIPRNINILRSDKTSCTEVNGEMECENVTNEGFGNKEMYYYKNLDKSSIKVVNALSEPIYVKVTITK